jgi:hypothetical protein
MSFASGLESLGGSGLPPINPADLPAKVRNGTPAEKQAYTQALGFEQVLVNELTQELSKTVASGGGDGSGSDGGGDSNGMSGLLGGGSDPATSTFADMIPTALSNSIMSGGGLGIAQQIAQSLDPSLALGGK